MKEWSFKMFTLPVSYPFVCVSVGVGIGREGIKGRS